MSGDEVLGYELLAAVRALDPAAAPLAAALVRAECIRVAWPTYAPLLALLDGLGAGATVSATDAAQDAMVRAWRGAQDRGPGTAAPWGELVSMGLLPQGRAAVMFGLSVTIAALQAAATRDTPPLLH